MTASEREKERRGKKWEREREKGRRRGRGIHRNEEWAQGHLGSLICKS